MKGIKPSTGATIRRLGVDYTLAKKRSHASSNLLVHKSRMKADRDRVLRLRRIMRKGAPNVFVMGVLPAAMYGVKHFEMS